jgi:hypothetical protein
MPLVPKGGGATTLNTLTDVDTSGAVDGRVLAYNAGLAQWKPAAPGGTSSTVEVIVAAADSPSAKKANADFICTGNSGSRIDHATINSALNSLPGNGGKVVLLPGTYYLGGSVVVGTAPGTGDHKTLEFTQGANLNWTTVSARTPLIQINSSQSYVFFPKCSGDGAAFNGTGIKFGDDTLGQPNGSYVLYPDLVDLDTGIEFGIQTTGGTESTGDCMVIGGRIRRCVDGILSKGFVNRCIGTFLSECNRLIHVTADRTSARFDFSDVTLNQWADAAIAIDGGRGSSIGNVWAERSDVTLAPTEIIRIGSAGATAKDVNFYGTLHLHAGPSGVIEQDIIKLVKSIGLKCNVLEFTNELPTRSIIRVEPNAENVGNRFAKVVCGDDMPVGWTSTKVLSNAGSTVAVAIEEFPGAAGSVAGTTLGGDWTPSARHTYTIFRVPGEDTYVTKNQAGFWSVFEADVTTGTKTSALKSAFADVAADGVSYMLPQSRYEFQEEPTGDEDHWAPNGFAGCTIEGAGMESTVIANWRDDSVGKKTPSSATHVGAVATYNFAAAHGFTAGQTVYPTGFSPTDYNANGAVVIASVPTSTSFTATLSTTPATNATVLGDVYAIDSLKDTEPISCTRCPNWTFRNLEIVHGGNRDLNNSSDTMDFDGCQNTVIEHVRLRRSRARAIVFDGGDSGAVSQGGRIHGVLIQGTPPPPMVATGVSGSITVQDYRYVVTWVDTLYGETLPGDYSKYTPGSGSFKARVYLPTGPTYKGKGVTSRKLYRWSASQPTWHLVTTIADNTTTFYDDGASDASIAGGAAPPTTGIPLIPMEGIKFLGSQHHSITETTVYAVGSHGIQAVRKGSDATTNKQTKGHRIEANIRYPGLGALSSGIAGIYLNGEDHIVSGCHIENPGIPGSLGYGVYLQNLVGSTTAGNIINSNTIIDTRDANHPQGAAAMLHAIRLLAVGGASAPIDNKIGVNVMTGMTGVDVNDGGSNTVEYSEVGHTHSGLGALTLARPRFIAGQFYGPRSVLDYSSLTTFALAANTIYGSPFYATEDVTLTTISFEVTGTGTATKGRLGIYEVDETDGLPAGSLWVGTTDVSLTSVTVNTQTINGGTGVVLTAQKWYIFALLVDGTVTVRGIQPTCSIYGFGTALDTSKRNAVLKVVGAGWSIMPASFPASPSLGNNVVAIDALAS